MQTNPIAHVVTGRLAVDTLVTIAGWVRTRRDSKAGLSFIQVSDGSCFATMQIVAPKELSNYESELLHLTAGCSIVAKGKLVASQGKGQAFEVLAEEIKVIGWVDDPDTYPISPKQHTMEHLREVAHLRPRTNTISAATRIRHTLAKAVHDFFDEEGFFWIHTPIITGADCEGAGAMFRVSTLDQANLPKTPEGKVD